MRARPLSFLISLIAVAIMAIGLAAPSVVAQGSAGDELAVNGFAVHHGPVEVSLVTAGSDGHQLGDVRVASVDVANARGEAIGRLEATLTTTSVDVPEVGDERRIGLLVFSFGDRGAHQITVQGTADYRREGPTIATGDVTVRPIVGGSGRFAGARGQAVTTHRDDGSWVHRFQLAQRQTATRSAREGIAERRIARAERWLDRAQGVVERARERLDLRTEAAGQRGEEPDTARAERRLDRTERVIELARERLERRTDGAREPRPGIAPAWGERLQQRAQERREQVRERTQERREQVQAWKERRQERAQERAQERRERREERRDARAEGEPATPVAVDVLYGAVPDDGTGVVRTDLGLAEPGSAAGQELGLWHYVIPAGEELAVHTHPGWQLARVTAGELEYTVVSGEGILLRADGSREPMGPGTYVLATGDGVIEDPELVHFGANRTDRPVTILSATLFQAGEPISTLTETPTE